MYGDDNLPAHLEYLSEQFDDLEVLGVSAKNGGLWSVKQGDVVLKGDRVGSPTTRSGGSVRTKLKLGGQAWAESTGKVRSDTTTVRARADSSVVAEIQEATKRSLEEFAESGDTLYEAWVNCFGEDSIQSDNR